MCYPLIKLRLSIDHGYVLHLRRFRRLPDIIEITYCMGSSVRWPGAMALVGYFAFPLFLSSLSFSFFFYSFSLYLFSYIGLALDETLGDRFRRKGRRARSRCIEAMRETRSPSLFAIRSRVTPKKKEKKSVKDARRSRVHPAPFNC